MDNDNLYPSGGFQPFAEPPAQKKARAQEKGEALAAQPTIEKMIRHFDRRIKFYDSVDSISPEDRNDPATFMHRFDANSLTKQNLEDEKEWLISLLDK